MDDRAALTDLLYRYAELIDAADFAGLRTLFARCRMLLTDEHVMAGPAFVDLLERTLVRYEDGTLRTKHVITNPIVEVENEGVAAILRSYYTVLQQAPGRGIETIAAGRYVDRFERIQQQWWFVERDYRGLDFVGDLSRHQRRT